MTLRSAIVFLLFPLALVACDRGAPAASGSGTSAATESSRNLHADDAKQLDASLIALERNDYATALEGFRTLAERGNAEAQFRLAEMYAEGQGVGKNFQKALPWYRRAAEQGHAEAQANVGFASLFGESLLDGKDDFEDPTEGIGWLRRAAEQGYEPAMHLLLLFYDSDDAALRNPAEAWRWYMELAERGDVMAQFHVAEAYRKGEGVAADPRAALRWYTKIAENPDTNDYTADAQIQLATAYSEGTLVPADDAASLRWLQRAAEQYSSEGKYRLGMRYLTGQTVLQDTYDAMHGVAHDRDQAMHWLREAANQGHAGAKYQLAHAYLEGRQGVERNTNEALRLSAEAAEGGSVDAQLLLAVLYDNDESVEQDYAKAAYWYRKAADAGNSTGSFHLGRAYLLGRGVERNADAAVFWLKKAAEEGSDGWAEYDLFSVYSGDSSLPPDNAAAERWLKRSADKGHKKAKQELFRRQQPATDGVGR